MKIIMKKLLQKIENFYQNKNKKVFHIKKKEINLKNKRQGKILHQIKMNNFFKVLSKYQKKFKTKVI